jgi:hypothetical protein
MYLRYTSFALLALLLLSCGNSNDNGRGAIRLGDSSTIVTETDNAHLGDFVTDIQSRIVASDTGFASGQGTGDTSKPAEAASPTSAPGSAPAGNELNVAFKDVTISIRGIQTKTYRNQDLQKANGATYQLAGGDLNGKQLRITGGTIQKVSQRYTTAVTAKTLHGTLNLDALSSTTDWTPLKATGNNAYTISGFAPNQLQYKQASPAQIRSAVARAVRGKRLSRRAAQQVENELRHVSAINQQPLSVALRSVMFKVEGKDAKGKGFQKQVRIDMPL